MEATVARSRTVRAGDLASVERVARVSVIQEGFTLVREGNPPNRNLERGPSDPRSGNLLLFERDVRYDPVRSRAGVLRAYLLHAVLVAIALGVGVVNFYVLRSPFLYLGVGLVVVATAVAILQSTPPLRFRSEIVGVRHRRTTSPSDAPASGSPTARFEVAVAGEEVDTMNRLVGRAPRSRGRFSRRVLLHRAAPACAAVAETVLDQIAGAFPDSR